MVKEVEAMLVSYDGAILSTGLVGIETKRGIPWWAYRKQEKQARMLPLPPSRKTERHSCIPTCCVGKEVAVDISQCKQTRLDNLDTTPHLTEHHGPGHQIVYFPLATDVGSGPI
jgi:hypothetical protein